MNKIINYWKNLDKTRILTHYIAPYFIGGGLLFALGLTIGGGNSGTNRGQEVTASISSTVDLPSQIKELQSKQSLVLQGQLNNIVVDDNSNDISEILTTFNQQTAIDDFMTAVLSLNRADDVDTQYQSLSKYLASDSSTGADDNNVASVEENMYNLIGGNSWSKETDSQTAKSGNSLISIMTGSNKEDYYYQVIVPATNEKRDNTNVVYFLHTDSSGKVANCVYGGAINSDDNANMYSDLSKIFKEK